MIMCVSDPGDILRPSFSATNEPCLAAFDKRLQTLVPVLGLEQFRHVRLQALERRGLNRDIAICLVGALSHGAPSCLVFCPSLAGTMRASSRHGPSSRSPSMKKVGVPRAPA